MLVKSGCSMKRLTIGNRFIVSETQSKYCNSLGKKLKNTEFKAVDEEFYTDFFVGDKHLKSNLNIDNLFRIDFDNPQREESLVYLTGKSPEGYQLSLSIENKTKLTN